MGKGRNSRKEGKVDNNNNNERRLAIMKHEGTPKIFFFRRIKIRE